MSDNGKLAENLTASLQLARPPIAVAFSDAAPANIPAYNGVAPAGCFFWQEAATRTFTTSSKDHAMCAIGIYTHHLAEPASNYAAELGEALTAMNNLNYVRPARSPPSR